MKKTKEMTQEREAAILEGAINKWGNTLQITVAIEELSELQKALCKYLRCLTTDGEGEKLYLTEAAIKEEIADVSIMLNQLEFLFGDCTDEEIAKLERLEKLVGLQPPCRWTPGEIEIAKKLRDIYPNIDTIRRGLDGGLSAVDSTPFRWDHLLLPYGVPLDESLFGGLDRGESVTLIEVIGGGKGGSGK